MRGGIGLVFNNDVENWKFHRRVFKRSVIAMVPHAGEVAAKNVHKLIDYWDKTLDANKPVDINEYTHKLSLDLIGELAFGLELNTITEDFNEISRGIYHG